MYYVTGNDRSGYVIKKDFKEKMTWTGGGMLYLAFCSTTLATIITLGCVVASGLFILLLPWLFMIAFIGSIASDSTYGDWNPLPHKKAQWSDQVNVEAVEEVKTVELIKKIVAYKELSYIGDENLIIEEAFNNLKLYKSDRLSYEFLKEFNLKLDLLADKCEDIKYGSSSLGVEKPSAVDSALTVADELNCNHINMKEIRESV